MFQVYSKVIQVFKTHTHTHTHIYSFFFPFFFGCAT